MYTLFGGRCFVVRDPRKLTLAIPNIKPEAGKGGRLGRSNMAYYGSNDEAKEAARKR